MQSIRASFAAICLWLSATGANLANRTGPQKRRVNAINFGGRWPCSLKVFFPEPKEVERYHRFPRRAVTLWPARMQAVFSLPKGEGHGEKPTERFRLTGRATRHTQTAGLSIEGGERTEP